MAEMMAVETIIEASWLLQGYWIKPRFPFKVKSGWSDVDVLAYHPERRDLVVAESKVQGTKHTVYAFTRAAKLRILEFDRPKGTLQYFKFLDHLGTICKDGTVFKDFSKMVQTVTVQLVSNYFVDPSDKKLKEEAISDIQAYAKKKCHSANVRVKARLDSTLEIISQLIKDEVGNEQGRRHGHPVLDVVREINRYVQHPKFQFGGGKSTHQRLHQEAMKILSRTFRNSGEERTY